MAAEDPAMMEDEELLETHFRLSMIAGGHSPYGVTPEKYGPTLRADLDAVTAEIRRRAAQ